MTEQTALDEFMGWVRHDWHRFYGAGFSVDASVGHAIRITPPGRFSQVLQDPRYLAYCQVQDEGAAVSLMRVQVLDNNALLRRLREQDRKEERLRISRYAGTDKPGSIVKH